MFQDYVRYFTDNPKGYWFKSKLFGWGWTPVKWQGWVVIALYVGFLIALFYKIDAVGYSEDMMIRGVSIPVIAATAVLFAICYWKGEKPHWQWGPPKSDDKKTP